MSNRTIFEHQAIAGPRWLLGAAIFGAMALVAGCVAAPTEVRTTTVERTTTQETVPVGQPTTTYTTTQQGNPYMQPTTTVTRTQQYSP
jgi:hypothetical protein